MLIDDSGPVLADPYLTPCLQMDFRTLFGLNAALPPDCPKCSSQADGGGLVNVYDFVQTKYPDAYFGLVDSVRDAVISLFFGYGTNNCSYKLVPTGFGPTLEAGLKDLAENELRENFATLLFPGSKHTYSSYDSFYTDMHEGKLLYEWYADLIKGKVDKVRSPPHTHTLPSTPLSRASRPSPRPSNTL